MCVSLHAPMRVAKLKDMTPTCSFLQRIGGYQTDFWINWVIIAFTAVFGLGMGGYASIRVCSAALPL